MASGKERCGEKPQTAGPGGAGAGKALLVIDSAYLGQMLRELHPEERTQLRTADGCLAIVRSISSFLGLSIGAAVAVDAVDATNQAAKYVRRWVEWG
jgi:hypothetical protein